MKTEKSILKLHTYPFFISKDHRIAQYRDYIPQLGCKVIECSVAHAETLLRADWDMHKFILILIQEVVVF